MNKFKNRSGFTLLEIIIVIIIVGVLASLSLPRFFSTVEFSRSTEALASIGALRQSIERCYLQNAGNYAACVNFSSLDLEDPQNSPNSHFVYTITAVQASSAYTIKATRRSDRDGGSINSIIYVTQTTDSVTRSGASAFQGIK